MSATIAPSESITSVIEKTRPKPPQKCHTVDHRGWAVCGAFGPEGGGELHSLKQCRARGHKQCVVCTELSRQLKGDRIVA